MSRLIADIGGTNARFAIVEGDSPAVDERHLLVADFPDPAAAIEFYLGGRRVEDAVIAVATPVETEVIGFTNSPWTFSISALKSRLGLRRLAVINDFAAQALAVTRELGLPDDAPNVNPDGGAIALGHPLGASGARLAIAATRQLAHGGGRYGLCAMCIGVGQGIALIIERV